MVKRNDKRYKYLELSGQGRWSVVSL
jgi:hypothetical protein